MDTLLMENITEIQEIVAECNTELIMIESEVVDAEYTEAGDSGKEEKKKGVVGEKIKKAWAAFKAFVEKWWNRFVDMIKKNKAVILNGKTEVDYKDFAETVDKVSKAIADAKETGKYKGAISHNPTKTGKVSEAVKDLEKNAAKLKKAINAAKPGKGEESVEDVTAAISFAQVVLTSIQTELSRVVASVGGKKEKEEKVEESFVSVLDAEDNVEEFVTEGFMSEAEELYYQNVSLMEHSEFVNNALEVFEIMAECEMVMEAEGETPESAPAEAKEKEKKKSALIEKIKKAWNAFVTFFKNWWFKFSTFVKGLKRHITTSAKTKTTKVDYKDYSGVVHVLSTDYLKKLASQEGGSASALMATASKQVVVKSATVDKALAELEKQGKAVSDLINRFDKLIQSSLRANTQVPTGITDLVNVLHSLLSKIQTETSGVARAADFKAAMAKEKKEKESKKEAK